MKKLTLWTLFCLFLIPQLTMAKFHPEADATLEKSQFWTQIYFKPDSETAVMNFRVWFEGAPEDVFKVLTDVASFKEKMNNYNEARVLTPALYKKIQAAYPKDADAVKQLVGSNKISSEHNRQKHQNWTDYAFFEFNFPWPLTDRWAVQKMRIDETNHQKGEYKLDYKMTVGNFKALSGYWRLKPVEGHPHLTEFYGRYESDPGMAVPKFLAKKGMRIGLKKDVEQYRKIIKAK